MRQIILGGVLSAVLLSVCAETPCRMASGVALAGEAVRDAHTEVELAAETLTLQPGTTGWLGLRFTMDPGWHIYWKNPGDSGLSPSVSWSLPDGFAVGELHWPFPSRIDAPPLTSYGYEGEALLPAPVQVSDAVAPGEYTLRADVNWLACEEACIPGKASVELLVRVDAGPPRIDPVASGRFAAARARLPIAESPWAVQAQRVGKRLVLTLRTSSGPLYSLSNVQFFPDEAMVIEPAAAQHLTRIERGYVLEMTVAATRASGLERVRGVLVSSEGWRGLNSERALAVDLPVMDAPVMTEGGGEESEAQTERVARSPIAMSTSPLALWLPFLFAFLGGVILNLMPCVFPVLSLKLLSFVRQAGEHPGALMKHGWVFAAGVMLSFWALAGVLMALRAGGQQIGWGFQLQSPPVVIALLAVFFLFALNLFGVFDIGASMTRLGGVAGGAQGYAGAFFSGVLATAVATPCTAPFMGAALGFALTQPALVGFGVFTCLGAGMASPYVLLCRFPDLLRRMPKPGPWMESLRQFMGFLLMVTVLWLLWVLEQQVARGALIGVLGGLLMMAAGVWVLGRWASPGRPATVRWLARFVAVVCLCTGLGVGLASVGRGASAAGAVAPARAEAASGMDAPAGFGLAWEPYSETRLAELRAAGRPVFLDFTAAWCLSCQVNERVALQHPEVVREFRRLGVTPMKADWTSYDDRVTAALASFGRNSIPLYVLYGRHPDEAPRLLPELLTPGIVLKALRDVAGSP